MCMYIYTCITIDMKMHNDTIDIQKIKITCMYTNMVYILFSYARLLLRRKDILRL